MSAPVILARPDERNGQHLVFHCNECNAEHVHGRCCASEKCPHGCPAALWRQQPRERKIHPVYFQCRCPVGNGDGHRAARCFGNPDSRYGSTGYVLRELR